MVWSQLEITKAHVAYSCIGVFSSIFSLVSLFVKERLYIGESMVAGIFGLIVGPHCLNWFNPSSWGNTDSITLEISRILLCLQVFAVSVELPRKYMLKHWISVTMLLVPVMTSGWLIIALFVWILVPGLNFPASLLMGACITATDPVLAQSVVSGTFAQKVPGHLRNLLSCESGCNDGLAFPFIFLSLDLLIYPGRGGHIVKDWFCLTILWECIFGSTLGGIIGFCGRKAIRFAESRRIIDRESFLAFYLILALMCAGFGSMLGVDDLLVSFFAGTTFAWDGWFAAKTHESNVSNVIDVLLNYAYFLYLGSILPWKDFNNSDIGLDVWRLIILALVVIFLRRIPAVLSLKPLIPDIKSWREAIFIGHFGPIGVGAVFAAITAKSQLESHITNKETPLKDTPGKGSTHWQAMACIWPITCFSIVTSVIVHGSSVAILMLGRHLSAVTLITTSADRTLNETSRYTSPTKFPLPRTTRCLFSLQHLNKKSPDLGEIGVRTSGMATTPALGMRQILRRKSHAPKNTTENFEMDDFDQINIRNQSKTRTNNIHFYEEAKPNIKISEEGVEESPRRSKKDRMNRVETVNVVYDLDRLAENIKNHNIDFAGKSKTHGIAHTHFQHEPNLQNKLNASSLEESDNNSITTSERERINHLTEQEQLAHIAYTENDQVIIENRQGEILEHAKFHKHPKDMESALNDHNGYRKAFLPPLERLYQIASETRKVKYHAYKRSNKLIIEDEEGNILREYKVDQQCNKGLIERSCDPVANALSSSGSIKSRRRHKKKRDLHLSSDDEMADDEAESEEDIACKHTEGFPLFVKKHAD